MKRYALIGEKLGHSYSKILHEKIFETLKIDAVYELKECKKEELKAVIEDLRNGIYSGYNVTIPYKKVIMNYLDEITSKAKEIGSVNTIFLRNGKVVGTNTDYDGFLAELSYFHLDVARKKCFVLGSGGASLAVCKALKDKSADVCVVSRTPQAGQIGYEELCFQPIDILINTTPVGMYPSVEACPLSEETILKAGDVVDIIFNPLQTRLLKIAHSEKNGLVMLVGQALEAEKYFQNRKIPLEIEELILFLKKEIGGR